MPTERSRPTLLCATVLRSLRRATHSATPGARSGCHSPPGAEAGHAGTRSALPSLRTMRSLHCVWAIWRGVGRAVARPAAQRDEAGNYQRTNVDASGFAQGYLTRQKRVQGLQTGDLVHAALASSLKSAGAEVSRVAVRLTGEFSGGQEGWNQRTVRSYRAVGGCLRPRPAPSRGRRSFRATAR